MRLGFRIIAFTGITVYLTLAAVGWFFHIDYPVVAHDGVKMRLPWWITYCVVLTLFTMPYFRTVIHLLFTGKLVNKYLTADAISAPLLIFGYCALTTGLIVKAMQPVLLPLLLSTGFIDKNRADVVQLLIALPIFSLVLVFSSADGVEIRLWSYRRREDSAASDLHAQSVAKATIVNNPGILNP